MTHHVVIILKPMRKTRLTLVKYYPVVSRDIANHKIDAAIINTGPNADSTIISQPNWLCNTPAVKDATATVAVVIRSAMP